MKSNTLQQQSVQVRKCLVLGCGVTEVHNHRWQERWCRYKDGWLCKRHYMAIIINPRRTKEYTKLHRKPELTKNHNDIKNPKKIRFKNLRIQLSYRKELTGFCSWCPNNIHDGSCRKTSSHHIIYIIIFPWFGTVEICNSCHAKETMRQRYPK